MTTLPQRVVLGETAARLEELPERLGSDVGAQLFVAHRQETLMDGAVGGDGRGRPMSVDTLFSVYCATKPLLGLVIAVLATQEALSYQARLGELLDVERLHRRVAELTLDDMLAHRAGLQVLTAIEANLAPEAEWTSLAARMPPADGFRVGTDQAYSEFRSWHLLAEVVTAVAGRPWAQLVDEWVIQPTGIAGQVFLPMPADRFIDLLPRLGVAVDLRCETGRPVALLLERSPRVATRANAAFGGYASARGLGQFASTMLEVSRGATRGPLTPAVLAATLPERPRAYDFVYGRPCAFGRGWMMDLRDHEITAFASPSSFGHTGHTSMRLTMADPQADIALGLVVNAVVDPDVGHEIRTGLIDAVYRDLGLEQDGGRT